MKKYLYIFKSEFMNNLSYIFNTIVGFAGYIILIFIFLNLWKYIYSDPNEVINGYTLNQMIWYVIITELLWTSLKGRKLVKKISDDIKTGNIAYNLNKPYNYVLYALSNHLGDVVIRFVMYLLIGMILGVIFLKSIPSLNIISIILVLLSAILAILINIMLLIAVGLLSFFIEDSGPFYWVYSKIILVLGTIFPIEYYPVVLQKILAYSPIYAVSYGPARMFVNFNYSEALKILLIQIIYIILSCLLCNLMYKKGVRKLNVNGG